MTNKSDAMKLRDQVVQLHAQNINLRDERASLFQQRAVLEDRLRAEREKVGRVEQELALTKADMLRTVTNLGRALSTSQTESRDSLPESEREYDDADNYDVGETDEEGETGDDYDDNRGAEGEHEHLNCEDDGRDAHGYTPYSEEDDEEHRKLRELEAEHWRMMDRLRDLQGRIDTQNELCRYKGVETLT
ncbi:hypothetical protein EUX98_g8910 [Antrodiella citrinella]|uniref:Uncharacterized protein n=1 Tax=Antrodiella citrinella TaxID=2447956 RepID=A0A4S4M182_9APHY|nr:hypothetical protein EUX98_g8910 [Antrodiella citrinella]